MSDLKKLIQALADPDEEIYSLACTVRSVNGLTCECVPVNGDADIVDVRLIADESVNQYVLVPKENSIVLVSFLNKNAGYVSMVSEIEKIYYKNGATEMQIDDKFLFKKGGEDLFKLMSDLIDAIKGEIHQTNSGPTLHMVPTSQAALEAIKQRFKNLLKEV